MSERRANEFGMSGYVSRADMEADTAATSEAADGWIEWAGGECPVSRGTGIDVRDRDGMEWLNVKALDAMNDKFMWAQECPFEDCDIIAYRVVPA